MRLAVGLARLAATIAALALALAPHLSHLPPWVSGTVAAAMAWRLAAERRGWALPPRALRYGAALAGTLAVLAGYRTLNGLDAGTALLAVMAGLKLLETRAPRDHAVLIFIGYFLGLAALLYEQSLARLAWVLLVTWLLTAALARVHRPSGADAPVQPFRLATRLLALGLPLALVMFLFVPRIEGRFWAIPASEQHSSSGIDEQMSPGDVAELGLSDDPAFRAWFDGPAPPSELRYWRVLVLEDFDGRTWRRTMSALDLRAPQIEAAGPALDYRIALEPTGRAWLPGLDTVVGWPEELAMRARSLQLVYMDRTLSERRRVTSPLSYSLRSSVAARVSPELLPPDLERRDLALPAGRDPRTRALAATLREGARDARELVARVLERFRTEPFSYTLSPPRLGADPVDEFLFRTRAGFCEHYASAFAVLMRAAGVPARVVIGYQGGELNRYGGYLLVRQSSAHAWNEIWLAGEGWVRVDPTAAVAPERVHGGRLTRELAGEVAPGFLFERYAWLAELRAGWDAVRTAWTERVVGFDPALQARLLDALGLGGRGWQGLAFALAAGFALGAAVLTAWLAWELRPRRGDSVDAAWARVCARLARAGLPRAAHEGPLDYMRRACAAAPASAGLLADFADLYVALRYYPGARPAARARFLALARTLVPRLSPYAGRR